MAETQGTVLIAGLGNEALRDEGIGIHVLRALAGRPLPPHIRSWEGATDGLALLGRLEGVRRLVLVDAMDMRRPAGALAVTPWEQLQRRRPAERTSLHGIGILDALELASTLELLPAEALIVGVQPGEIAPGLDLSPALARALPAAVQATLNAALAPFGAEEKPWRSVAGS